MHKLNTLACTHRHTHSLTVLVINLVSEKIYPNKATIATNKAFIITDECNCDKGLDEFLDALSGGN